MNSHSHSATLIPVKTHRLILILSTLLLVLGCERKEEIRAYVAPKDPPQAAIVAADDGGPIHWITPKDWKRLPASQMVYAAYEVSDDPPVKLTVSEVTSMGEGVATILPNVTRWQRQLGLPPATEGDLSKLITTLQIAGRDAQIVDLTGPNPAPDGKPQQRMLGALIPDGAKWWAFKMTGPPEQVAAYKAAFETVVKSVTFSAAASDKSEQTATTAPPTTPTPPIANQDAKIDGLASFTLPQGWRVDPTPRQMRKGTIIIPADNTQAEIIITQFNRNSLSDVMMNLNRWRNQVHLPPAADANANPPQEITLAQGPALVRDFPGPDSDGPARLRQIVAYTQFPNSDAVWFFRFVGPYDAVTQHKPEFDAFVRSLKFE
jgi:hypothetical protein